MRELPEVGIGTEIVESRGGFGFRGYIFGKIIRETKKQWVADTGTKYWKENLTVVGDYGRLEIKTQKHVDDHNKYSLKSQIGSIAYDIGSLRNKIPDDLTTEQLKTLLAKVKDVYEIIKPEESR